MPKNAWSRIILIGLQYHWNEFRSSHRFRHIRLLKHRIIMYHHPLKALPMWMLWCYRFTNRPSWARHMTGNIAKRYEYDSRSSKWNLYAVPLPRQCRFGFWWSLGSSRPMDYDGTILMNIWSNDVVVWLVENGLRVSCNVRLQHSQNAVIVGFPHHRWKPAIAMDLFKHREWLLVNLKWNTNVPSPPTFPLKSGLFGYVRSQIPLIPDGYMTYAGLAVTAARVAQTSAGCSFLLEGNLGR